MNRADDCADGLAGRPLQDAALEVNMLVKQKTFVAAVAAAAGLAFASVGYGQTSAQAPPPASPAARRPAQNPRPAGPPPAGQPGAGPMRGLNLTEAQREQVRTLREAQRKDSQALRDKMQAARQQLRQAMRADVPDEAAVRSAAGAVAALQSERAVQQARARGEFMKVLTPEQQARLKEARARAAERAQRAMRAQRQMMRRERMMGPAQRPLRQGRPGMGRPMGRPMMGPMWRQPQMRQDGLRRWRGWI